MKFPLAACLPALALTLALTPNGSSVAPPHLGAAIAEQRDLVAARPQDPGVWNDLGNLLALAGSLDEAQSSYRRALELDPSSIQAHFNLGLLEQQRGDLDGAGAEYRALLEIEPTHAWAQYQLGAVYEAQGEREPALQHYSEAFTLDPELLFAENNPHIIENRLVTEALLRAHRHSRAAPPAPRVYNERDRIESILKPSSRPAPGDVGPSEEEGAEPAQGEETTGAPGAADAGAAIQAPRNGAGRGARSPQSSTASDSPEVTTTTGDRVLDSGDLRGKSVRNQVHGDAEGGAGPAAGSRRRAAATVTPGGRRSPVNQPAADPSGAFGTGLRSTGSLEWKLGPAADEPVPAR